MIRAFLVWFLCSQEIHDVGTAHEGVCRRCHLNIGPDGNAIL